MMTRTFIAILLPCLALGGCVSQVDRDFGKAQAQMLRLQVYNAATLLGAQDAPVEGMDADAAKAAIDAFRKDVADRSGVRHDIPINVGNNQPSGSQ